MSSPSTQRQWSEEVAQHLRPTMIIGLGGSGKDVLLRVRRLFYERMGRNPDGSVGYPIIGYLALDTDPGAPGIMEGDSAKEFVMRSISFQMGGNAREFIDCSMKDQDVATYFRGGAAQYPHIFQWLRPEMEKFGAAGAALATGAGQNRQLARLAFFHHYAGTPDRPGIRPTLERHLDTIIRQAREPNLRESWLKRLAPNATVGDSEDGTLPLEVILVYSLAGGTGAGMFLDMGMLVRDVVKGFSNLKPYFTHFVLLPEPFLKPPTKDRPGVELPPEERKKIQENAYAALREMEYFSMRADQAFDLTIPPDEGGAPRGGPGTPFYEVKWERGGRPVVIDSAPWDTCYLVGGSNDPLGDTVTPRDAYQMTAEFIFLDFDPNQFGTRRRMRRPNMQGRLQEQAIDEIRDERGTLYTHLVSRRYSTFGLSQIYFDRARMRRAASYRLAVSLLDHWMRDLGLAPPTRKQYATADLQGTLLPGEKGAPVTLTFEKVRDLLLLKDRKTDRQNTWMTDIEEDAAKLRTRVEAGQERGGPGWIKEMLAQHDERLRRNPLGGREGVARESMLANARGVKEEIEGRLRRLFLARVQEFGVPETKRLLEEYHELLQPHIRTADGWTRAPVRLPALWQDRLEEAASLPDWPLLLRPARRAVRAELIRGLKEAGKHLRNRYTLEASEEVRESLQLAAARVGRASAGAAEARGSYRDLLDRFTDLQGRARGYLEARFGESRKDDTTQKRTRGLLEHWDAETYDREIRSFLGQGAAPREFLAEVEKRVLARLREQKGREEAGKWDAVDGLGQLILHVLPLDRGSLAPEAFIEEFARDLADACWSLLEGFCKDRSALALFDGDPDQQQLTLEILRLYSAPFLRRSSEASQTQGSDTVSLIQLGLANHTSGQAETFRRKLIESGKGGQVLSSLQAFSAQDDAIILCQEKHGLPLYFYQFLEPLGQAYYASTAQPERHIDFEFLHNRLPEIRKIDFAKQKHLGNCLELALQGIMTGALYWDRGQFWMAYSISQYAPRVPYPQGSQLESIIHRYAENAGERTKLTGQINAWVQSARQQNDGARLALLWCDVEDLVAEVSRRVQLLVNRTAGTGATTARREHPMVSILCSENPEFPGLLVRLREQLTGLPGGARWLRSRIDRHYLVSEYQGPDLERLLSERDGLLAPGYQPTLPGGLPIRVIRPDAVLRIDDVQWSGPDGSPRTG